MSKEIGSDSRNLSDGEGDACTIVVSETTKRLIEDEVAIEAVGKIELKGKSERIGAYRVRSAATSDQASEHPLHKESEL